MRLRSHSFLLTLLLSVSPVWAQAATQVEVFKSPYCGCCEEWIAHLRQNGFQVTAHNMDNVSAIRKQLGMPDKFTSCHTARVGGYIVEGHVPAADLKRMLSEKPRAVGLAVPSMSPGSPGMESSHPIPYNTLLVQADGSYRAYEHH